MSRNVNALKVAESGDQGIVEKELAYLRQLDPNDIEYQASVTDLRLIVNQKPTFTDWFFHLTEADALDILKGLGVKDPLRPLEPDEPAIFSRVHVVESRRRMARALPDPTDSHSETSGIIRKSDRPTRTE